MHICFLFFFYRAYVSGISHQFHVWVHHAIHGALADDEVTARDADASARAQAEERRVLHLGVVHQLDHLVQQDTHRRDTHAVLQGGGDDVSVIEL